eukprot:2588605-Rhodomonas_salina.1
MLIEEKADMMSRACCAPEHSLLVHFYATDQGGNKGQPLMTMERPGHLPYRSAQRDTCRARPRRHMPYMV